MKNLLKLTIPVHFAQIVISEARRIRTSNVVLSSRAWMHSLSTTNCKKNNLEESVEPNSNFQLADSTNFVFEWDIRAAKNQKID